MTRFSFALTLAVFAAAACADEPPILRYTSYVLLETGGKPTSVVLQSGGYAATHKDYIYKDQPAYAVIGADGQLLDEVDGRLGVETTLQVPAAAGDFALIEVRPGNNYCVARPAGAYGYVATETAPLNVVRGFDRLYFMVPQGLTAASIFFHAFSVREAGRAVICDPDGKAVVEAEDDFNEPRAVSFQVPKDQSGKVWSLSLLAPKNPNWTIDDCKVWLGGSLLGVLAPRPDWAERLSRPFIVNWRTMLDFEGKESVATVQYNVPSEEGAQVPAFKVDLSTEQARSGSQSLRIEMRLPDNAAKMNELKIFTKPLDAGSVQRIKFWLYGDGSGRRLTVRVRDQDQEHHYCPAGTIAWKGWGEVTADFAKGPVRVSGGDGNRKIDGPKIVVVIQIGHEQGQPTHSIYYIDDLAVSP